MTHMDLLTDIFYAREIIDIFNVSIFTQIIASVIIICMTGLRLLTGHYDPWATTGDVFYLLAMICQIWQFCYVGNEVSHSRDVAELWGKKKRRDIK
ncbi:conserved hypothetical protein [Culex quinquefasciatus]|uniref:Uncharacterized protein n=1 Tax=Culex quinquefasciatus TaxID=7176 RepID=B0W1S1_CULQU|nr:conserved hypothetical protein [Culex quinquefasciatus]|eukprot:XP_001842655.1 conserved hypothetical protein [Culex quinquefasciatus]